MSQRRQSRSRSASKSRSRSPERSHSRSRSRDKGKTQMRYKQMIMDDIKSQQKKLRDCYGQQIEEQDLPLFVWGKPQQETLLRLIAEETDQKSIRHHFSSLYKEAIKAWQGNRAAGTKQQTYEQYLEKEAEFHAKQELQRAFMRIQQGREQPIDKFVKMVYYMYKGKMKLDKTLVPIMQQPKKYLGTLTKQQLEAMLPEAEIHSRKDREQNSEFLPFWDTLIELIRYKISRKDPESANSKVTLSLKKQFKEKIKQMLNKSLPQLQKLEAGIEKTIKNAAIGSDTSYWQAVLMKLRAKKMQCKLVEYYTKFMEKYTEDAEDDDEGEVPRIVTSPILAPLGSVPFKLLTTDQQQKAARNQLAQKIFRQDFQKAQSKLQTNLSLPKNHNLLATPTIDDVNKTYEYIADEILEFERYKRLEQDQEDFNDWLPCQTEGRFRDRKPVYVNRVRVSCEWNKYNQTHYDNENPPPKTVQGYKFNIFYPDLLDKSKTPQYYFEPTQDPDTCIIKFKAGPPYLDVAFKILRRQWDFSDKSGFESIFAKGILHLYFNFKKPRFRI